MSYPIDSAVTGGGYSTMSGSYIPNLFAKEMLSSFYAATVFGEIANTDYEGEVKNQGDKLTIRLVPTISVADHEIGDVLTYERPQASSIDLYLNKGKRYGFEIDDVERYQSDLTYATKFAENASDQMKIAIDAGILDTVIADAAAANTGATAGAISGAIDLGVASADGSSAIGLTKANVIDYIVAAGQALDEQNVPEQDRWIVLPAWAIARIKTSELKDASLTGDGKSILRNGLIGSIDRFKVFSSNQVKQTVETSVTSYACPFGHKSALTFASQLIKNETLKNPTGFGELQRGLQVYGYKVIRPEAMGVLYTKAAV